MFKKENWKTEKIILGLSRIPVCQAHLIIWIAMFCGLVFIIGGTIGISTLKLNFDSVPLSLMLMMIGLGGFILFFPLSYIVYLAKELQKTKDRLEELEKKKNLQDAESNGGNDPV